MSFHYTPRGIGYISVEWFFNACELSIVALRLYSRTFLTRSVGSDDFAIVLGCFLDVVGGIIDLQAFQNGWAQHETNLSEDQYSKEQKWEYISIITGYLSFFFIRASILLFVLRLLPLYKKAQQRVVYLIFFINFAITLAACVMFGISCIPFQAIWNSSIQNPKCFSKKQLVIVNQVNASLACACDIITALIPQFLLWNLQMKRRTKRQLNFLFGLGLITAALSIGRAATTTEKSLTEDSTWNEVPTYYFFDFEAQLGIIFACGPAIRQFYAYCHRTRSALPTNRRQYPNEDFEKMRIRVNLRDIFWFRQASMTGGRVFDATPMFQRSTPPNPINSDAQREETVKKSVLDKWESKIRNLFTSHDSQQSMPLSSSAEKLAKTTESTIGPNSSKPNNSVSNYSNNLTFLQSGDTETASSRGVTGMNRASPPLSPLHDYELAENLANPKTKPIGDPRRV